MIRCLLCRKAFVETFITTTETSGLVYLENLAVAAHRACAPKWDMWVVTPQYVLHNLFFQHNVLHYELPYSHVS
jgi:hypothetical protein